jgi:hypothetical protein
MKIIRRLLIVVLAILLVGTTTWVVWATVKAQPATARAVAVLQENEIRREDRFLDALE